MMPQIRRTLLNAVILFHLLAVVLLAIPIDVPLKMPFLRVVRPYLLFTGLWQNWKMFAPLPPAVNEEVLAFIEFSDGTSVVAAFPRVQEMGYAERYARERFRKWQGFLRLSDYAFIFPDAARWIGRHYVQQGRIPRRIVLAVRGQAIVPPGVRPRPPYLHRMVSFVPSPPDWR